MNTMETKLFDAIRNNDKTEVERLIKQGVNLNVNNGFNETPIFIICNNQFSIISNNQLELLKVLIEKGADIHAKNDDALRWAVNNEHLNVVEYLKSL